MPILKYNGNAWHRLFFQIFSCVSLYTNIGVNNDVINITTVDII